MVIRPENGVAPFIGGNEQMHLFQPLLLRFLIEIEIEKGDCGISAKEL
jgi:hypothetical protein